MSPGEDWEGGWFYYQPLVPVPRNDSGPIWGKAGDISGQYLEQPFTTQIPSFELNVLLFSLMALFFVKPEFAFETHLLEVISRPRHSQESDNWGGFKLEAC